MLRLIGVFLLGVYVGQEFKNIPNINKHTNNIYETLKKTEIYNILSRDYKKVVEDDEKENKKWF
jgi:hypothetical protein